MLQGLAVLAVQNHWAPDGAQRVLFEVITFVFASSLYVQVNRLKALWEGTDEELRFQYLAP